jgi:hypothetical protein
MSHSLWEIDGVIGHNSNLSKFRSPLDRFNLNPNDPVITTADLFGRYQPFLACIVAARRQLGGGTVDTGFQNPPRLHLTLLETDFSIALRRHVCDSDHDRRGNAHANNGREQGGAATRRGSGWSWFYMHHFVVRSDGAV